MNGRLTMAVLVCAVAAEAQLPTPGPRRPMMHTGAVLAVAFSPSGKLLASGGTDRTVRVWDVAQRTPVRSFSVDSMVVSVAFSPDGMRLAAVTHSGAILQWDTRTWAAGASGRFPARSPSAVTYSPSSRLSISPVIATTGVKQRRLLAVSGPERVRIYDADGARTLTKVGEIDLSQYSSPADQYIMYVNAIAFTPNGQTLATGGTDHRVKFWDTRTWQQQQPEVIAPHPADISFARDGKSVASGGDHFLRVWEPSTGALIRDFPAGTFYSAVALSPDGKTLASAGAGSGVISFLDVASGALKRSIDVGMGLVHALAFSPDGSLLASAAADKSVRLWAVP